MDGYVYILKCSDGSFYTGSTVDLIRRIIQHQKGLGANHTSKRLPVSLVYCYHYRSIATAFRREKQIQGWSHTKKQALISGNTNLLHELAACQNESHLKK